MLRNYTMTWSLQKIENIFPWIEDTTNDFTPSANVVEESTYGIGSDPMITLYAASTNTAEIYLQEFSGASSSQRVWLIPGQAIELSYSVVKAMNIFYVTWTASDVLFVMCR